MVFGCVRVALPRHSRRATHSAMTSNTVYLITGANRGEYEMHREA
jgi:hypothetical protein